VPDLKAAASALPATPGVYLFKDAKGRVLYIGKALSLRDRVRSYFAGAQESKTARMLEQVADLETLEAPSETDALLLESRLVKDLKPRYNILLKDDKSFPWIVVSEGEDFPRVEVTRETQVKGFRYYGPFMDATGLHRSLQVLQGVFQFRTCSLDLREDDHKRRYHYRPCLLHHIRRCTAPCAEKVSKEDYAEQLSGVKRVLAGDKKGLLAELKARMAESSGRMDFEKAAFLRDQIKALESLDKRGRFSDRPDDLVGPLTPSDGLEELRQLLGLKHPVRRIEGMDIAILQGQDAVGSVVAFEDGIPFKDRYRRYRIKTVSGMDDFAMVREVVSRRFRGEDDWMPQVLLVDGGKGQWNAAAGALESSLGGSGVCLVSLAKREERLFTPDRPEGILLPRRSGALRVCQFVRDEAHRFAGRYHALLRRKRMLGGFVPKRGRG